MFGINDPSALLRPWKDLKQFSEELYAMFTASQPDEPGRQSSLSRGLDFGPTESGRRTVAAQDDAPSAPSVRESRITEARSKVVVPEQRTSNSHASARRASQADHPTSERTGFRPTPAPPVPASEFVGPMDIPEYVAPPEVPLISGPMIASASPQPLEALAIGPMDMSSYGMVDAAGIIIDAMSHGLDPSKGFSLLGSDWQTSYPDAVASPAELPGFNLLDFGPVPTVPAAAGGDSSVFIGKIVSGDGKSYKVQLFPDGLDSDPGDTVDVAVPILADGENLTTGSLIVPIVQAGEFYYYQPPVWMD